jgi:hypothetical protein
MANPWSAPLVPSAKGALKGAVPSWGGSDKMPTRELLMMRIITEMWRQTDNSRLSSSFRRFPMKCFVCGSDMRLTMVEPHDAVARPGFEYRTFQCESCGDTERRFVFDARASVDLTAIGPT